MMWADARVWHHTVGRASTPEESWVRLLRHAGMWSLMGFGYWVVETHRGDFVGEAGLAAFRRALTPPQGDAPEAGWVLAPDWHGRGMATEAMRAIMDWADTALASPHSFCVIHPENAASLAVARKLGHGNAVAAQSRDEPAQLLTRPRA